MRLYWKYIRPYKFYFVIGPLLILTEVASEIILPKMLGEMIDVGIIGNDRAYIIQYGIKMLGYICVQLICGILGLYFSLKASIYFTCDLRDALFEKIQLFSFKNINKFSVGSLVTRLTGDINQIQGFTRQLLISALRAPCLLLGGFIMAALINVRLSVIIAVSIPVLIIAVFLFMKAAYPRFIHMQEKLDALTSKIQESIINIRIIKSFVRTNYETEKFVSANNDLRDGAIHAMNIMIFTIPAMTMAVNIITLLSAWIGGSYVINGVMEVGELTAFITYIAQILMSFTTITMIILQSSRASASSKRISEVLAVQPDLTDSTAKYKDNPVPSGKIEFKNVSFKYNDDDSKNILTDINLTIESGTFVGIIGVTGSGKTSLVQLIPRLYDACEGEVLVGGINVKDYSIPLLRKDVAMVLQNNILFSDSVEDNLKWGKQDASDDEIRAAAKAAQADEFIRSFSQGYNTQLNRGGANVSGGQRQRLCIARAIVNKPKILILDDSVSAVDTATEAKIRSGFDAFLTDTTKIMITQRINSIINADIIVVLDDGKIDALGTHDELLKSSGIYRDMYYSQNNKGESA